MQRRDFLKSSVALAVAAEFGTGFRYALPRVLGVPPETQ